MPAPPAADRGLEAALEDEQSASHLAEQLRTGLLSCGTRAPVPGTLASNFSLRIFTELAQASLAAARWLASQSTVVAALVQVLRDVAGVGERRCPWTAATVRPAARAACALGETEEGRTALRRAEAAGPLLMLVVAGLYDGRPSNTSIAPSDRGIDARESASSGSDNSDDDSDDDAGGGHWRVPLGWGELVQTLNRLQLETSAGSPAPAPARGFAADEHPGPDAGGGLPLLAEEVRQLADYVRWTRLCGRSPTGRHQAAAAVLLAQLNAEICMLDLVPPASHVLPDIESASPEMPSGPGPHPEFADLNSMIDEMVGATFLQEHWEVSPTSGNAHRELAYYNTTDPRSLGPGDEDSIKQ